MINRRRLIGALASSALAEPLVAGAQADKRPRDSTASQSAPSLPPFEFRGRVLTDLGGRSTFQARAGTRY
jgi:hypothetical protein